MVLLEGLNDKGAVIYQIPARLDDLLNLRPLDTSIDDYSYYFSVGGTHDDGSFVLNDGLKGIYNQFNMSGTRSDGITASADRNF